MPDQNSPAQDPNTQTPAPTATPPVSQTVPGNPIVTIDADTPPLPPDFQNIVTPPMKPSESASGLPAEASAQAGSAAPNDTPPIVTSSPKKKFGGGKIIATILGLLLLVGGVGAGLILTQQQQIFQPQASVWCPGGKTRIPKGGTAADCPGGAQPAPAAQTTTSGNTVQPGQFGYKYPNGDVAGTYVAPNGQRYLVQSPGTAEAAAKYINSNPADAAALNFAPSVLTSIKNGVESAPAGGPVSCSSSGYSNFDPAPVSEKCKGGGYNIEKVAHSGCPAGTSSVNGVVSCWCTTDSSNCTGNATGERTTTTSTPNPTAQCQGVTAYSATWTALTASDLSALKSGTTINFCVGGSSSSGSFDKAKFTINGVAQAETTAHRPSSSDFCQSYQIPASVSSFSITAQIHHATLGWSL